MLVPALLAFCAVTLLAAPPASKGYRLAFEDNFSGTALDTAKWSPNYPWGTTHNHMANMQASQITVSGGYLNLKAEHRRSINSPWGYWDNGFNKYISFDYTSGAVHTQNKFHFTRGYLEARIKMPRPQSTWPAILDARRGVAAGNRRDGGAGQPHALFL